MLVNGAGPIGLVAAQTALAYGAAEVIAADVNPTRLRLAAELGATQTIDVSATPLAEAGFTPDVLLECSGHPGRDRRRDTHGRPCRAGGAGGHGRR
ncbi:MAG: zinc-binding dehydrogenase [Micromonosporaceae bacterium]